MKDYNIRNLTNYKKRIYPKNIQKYVTIYIQLMTNFLEYSDENIHIQNKTYFLFIIKRGLETFTHVFMMLLMYTKNIELVSYHCKKSFFYYIEFIGQISEESHSYLQLNSKDAALFVYKKTVFQIINEIKENLVLTKDEKKILKFLSKISTFHNKYILYCLRKKKLFHGKKEPSIINFTSKIKKIFENFFKNKENHYKKIKNMLFFFDILELQKIEPSLHISLVETFCKKNNKLDIDKKKIWEKLYSKNAQLFIKHYTPLKFINWLVLK